MRKLAIVDSCMAASLMKHRIMVALAGVTAAGLLVGTARADMETIGNPQYLTVPGPYTMINLGAPGTSSTAMGLNESGQVVGNFNDFGLRAFLYTDGLIQELGAKYAYRINDSGQVVTSSGLIGSNGEVIPLGDLGQPGAAPEGLNNAGQVVGRSRNASGHVRAFVWQDGVMSDLGTLGGKASYGTDINDAGQVTGYAESSLSLRAFVWQDGDMTDLGSLYGTSGASYGYAINSLGHVAGRSKSRQTSSAGHAFLWSPEGGMIDLGTFGGRNSHGVGINSADQVVGYASYYALWESDEISSAFIWSQGFMYDLNQLTDMPEGWHLTRALDINERGWIAASARDENGAMRAVMLIPEPSTLALTLFAIAAITALKKRRRWATSPRYP